jgi:drug/metabolite transporter (DMT)-like permease
MPDHLKGLLFATLGVLFIVPESLLVRLIGAGGLTLAFWKAALTGGVIALIVLAREGPGGFARVLALGPRAWFFAAATGLSGSLFVVAVTLTSVAHVVFIVAAMPAFAALISRVALGEPISRRTGVTIVVVMAGIAIIAFGSGQTSGAHLSGDLVALAVAAIFGAGLTAARSLRPASITAAIPLGYLAAALILLPVAEPLAVAPDRWGLVALHGAVFMVVSTLFVTAAPRYLPSAEVGLVMLLESVLAPLLVWAVLGEAPGGWGLIGGALVLGALAVSNAIALARPRAAPRANPPPPLPPHP